MINLDAGVLVGLKNAVSGHCGICGAHGLHDHFDCHLHFLVCADDAVHLLEAERVAHLLGPNSEPLPAYDIEVIAKIFHRRRVRYDN